MMMMIIIIIIIIIISGKTINIISQSVTTPATHMINGIMNAKKKNTIRFGKGKGKVIPLQARCGQEGG